MKDIEAPANGGHGSPPRLLLELGEATYHGWLSQVASNRAHDPAAGVAERGVRQRSIVCALLASLTS